MRLCQAFDSWKAVAAYLGNLRGALHALSASTSARLLRRCLLGWLDAVWWTKRLAAGRAAARQLCFARTAPAVVAAWRAQARQLRTLRGCMARLAHAALRGALAQWSAHVRRTHGARDAAERLLRRLLNRTLAEALAEWAQAAAEGASKRASMRRALAFFANRTLCKV